MTAIAAHISKERVWMASDKYESVDDAVYLGALPKIRNTGKFLIGAAGDTAGCNAVVHGIRPPAKKKSETWDQYFAWTLPRTWHKEMKDCGLESTDIEVLIATSSSLWHYAGYMHAAKLERDFHAIGAGATYCLGAWHAGERNAQLIIQAAAEHCTSVSHAGDYLEL